MTMEELEKLIDDQSLFYQVDMRMNGRAEPMGRRVVRSLAEAGVRLITLPEPTSVRTESTDEGETYTVAEWVTDLWYVSRFGDGELTMHDRIGPDRVTDEHLRETAAAMLAAAEGNWP
ncbi:hypothetical protein GS534_00705 [Rhodococcus hoagii]|nr:hypothetical protein [Prescottella equi]